MRNYEALIVLDCDLQEDALEIAQKEIAEILGKYQCEVLSSENLGKKPLNAQATKKNEGIFYLVKFSSSPEKIIDVKRDFTLNENIVNTMVSKLDEVKTAGE